MAIVDTAPNGKTLAQKRDNLHVVNTTDSQPDLCKPAATMPDYNILSSMTVRILRPSGTTTNEVLDSFLTQEGQTMFATERDTTHYSFDALMSMVRDGLEPGEAPADGSVQDKEGRIISDPGEFRCCLLAIVTGKCQMRTDKWGNPCLELHYKPLTLAKLQKSTSPSPAQMEARVKKDLRDLRRKLTEAAEQKRTTTMEEDSAEPRPEYRPVLRAGGWPCTPASTVPVPTAEDKIEIVNEQGDIVFDDGRSGWKSSSAGPPLCAPRGLVSQGAGTYWDDSPSKTGERNGWSDMESEYADMAQVKPKNCPRSDYLGVAKPVTYQDCAQYRTPTCEDLTELRGPQPEGW